MNHNENIRNAWEFFIKNPKIIYLFICSKTIRYEELVKRLQEEPINLSDAMQQKMIEQIRSNSLFIEDNGVFRINDEISYYIVEYVKESLGISKKNNLEDEGVKNHIRELEEQNNILQEQLNDKYVVISDIIPDKIFDDFMEKTDIEISDEPLITGFKAPSIYSNSTKKYDICDKLEYFKNNLESLNQGLSMSKLIMGKGKQEKRAVRKKLLKRLLDGKDKLFSGKTSLQKLLYYLCLYPDVTKEQKRNIYEACENGLNATIILELMELNPELYSPEYFDYMIELAKKQGELQAMVDVSKKLILGEWYVTAEVDGIRKKFVLRPV